MAQRRPPASDVACPDRDAGARWPLRAVACVLAAVGVGAIIVGCASQEQRYRVLSIFFDGVPVPESLRQTMPELFETETSDTSAAVKPDEQRVVYRYHTPYASRSCFGCHDRQAGFAAPTGGMELCQKCHESHFTLEVADWAHGPAILGQCRLCHEPHKSEHHGLLTAAQPGLCFQCHDSAWMTEDPMHRLLPADVACSTCHDPHAAGNRLLLADSRTYRRRTRSPFDVASAHNMWTQQDCLRCHDEQRSNMVKEGVDQRCLECHAAVSATLADAAVHQAVRDVKCTTCHTPHRSWRERLLRGNAEKMCLGCHDVAKLHTPAHPPVTRVDCLLCHRGHHADEPHLLKTPAQVAAGLIPTPAVDGDDAVVDPQAMPVEGQGVGDGY